MRIKFLFLFLLCIILSFQGCASVGSSTSQKSQAQLSKDIDSASKVARYNNAKTTLEYINHAGLNNFDPYTARTLIDDALVHETNSYTRSVLMELRQFFDNQNL